MLGAIAVTIVSAAALYAVRRRRWPAGAVRATVIEHTCLTADHVRLRLRVHGALSFLPGQWVDLCITPRLIGGYSICSAPEELPELALIVKRSAHPPTRAVHEELRAGCEVRVRTGGAAGVDLAREWTHRPAPHLVLIGGGIGVTPVLGIVAAAARAPCEDPRARISVLYSCRDACDFVGVAELAAAARLLPALHVRLFHTNASHADRCEVPGRDVHVFSVASRRMCERDVREVLTGSPTGCLAAAAADRAPLVLVCGPKAMQDAVLAWCRVAGVPEERLVYETWW